MRFHVVSLPHTQATDAFASCAFTQKVRRFCRMMMGLGHTVFLYAGEDADVERTELITCITETERAASVGDKHYTAADWMHPAWKAFNQAAIDGIAARAEPRDFICLIGGIAHKPIADAFPAMMSVEFGIGYAGTFAKYRVFESYAWMHTIYGAQAGNAAAADGQWFDAVIPNQVDEELFPTADKGDYFLYCGRLIDRKGYRVAQEVCERMGARLILAGPGEHIGYGEFVGEVGEAQRGNLMAGALALFAPTIYIEPFGTVAIEAMACGTPVISSDWGAFTETVENGVTGYRCRSLAEFMDAARNVGALDAGLIRSQALARFGMKSVAPLYESYFNRLSTLWGDGWYQLPIST